MTTKHTRLLANFIPMLSINAVRPGKHVVIFDLWKNQRPSKAVTALAAEQLGAQVLYIEAPNPNRLPVFVDRALVAA